MLIISTPNNPYKYDVLPPNNDGFEKLNFVLACITDFESAHLSEI